MMNAIPARVKVEVTLKFLATGNTYRTLQSSFRGNGVGLRSRQHLHYHRNIRKHIAYRNIQRGKTEKAF